MARYVGPQCRLCRTENTKLFLKGERCYSAKCPIAKKAAPPGKGPIFRAKKMSDYGTQLRQKQKLKRIFGMLEKQFKLTFQEADRLKGKTGDNLISLLERRLDNTVYRMRFASSRKQARQFISNIPETNVLSISSNLSLRISPGPPPGNCLPKRRVNPKVEMPSCCGLYVPGQLR